MKATMDVKRFDKPDSTRNFPKGRFDGVTIGEMTIGRAEYEPGWVWSRDVGAATGQTLCQVEHHGMVLSGAATAEFEDGTVLEMRAGDLFYIPPGHDSRVIGDEPYVSLHFSGAESYAKK
jgi:mannose-6-phosphate isomerase-like protein (cupin superfamily)